MLSHLTRPDDSLSEAVWLRERQASDSGASLSESPVGRDSEFWLMCERSLQQRAQHGGIGSHHRPAPGPGGRDCGTGQPACQCRPAISKAYPNQGNKGLGKCWEHTIEWGKQSPSCMSGRSPTGGKSTCERETAGGKTNQTASETVVPTRGTFGSVWGHCGCLSQGGGAAGF